MDTILHDSNLTIEKETLGGSSIDVKLGVDVAGIEGDVANKDDDTGGNVWCCCGDS